MIRQIKTYPGGKGASGTYQTIINHIRPHGILIIPFLGNCAILRNISRSNHTICIDADPRIINYWKQQELDRVTFLCGDGIQYLENLSKENFNRFAEKIVVYCDPPYPISSRKGKRKIYKHEMTDEDHLRLLNAITKLKCDVLISTYPNDLYISHLLNCGWLRKSFQSKTRVGMATENLYMNYSDITELHDYSYLGKNFRERERIRNKIKRFTHKLSSLPTLERKAIITSII